MHKQTHLLEQPSRYVKINLAYHYFWFEPQTYPFDSGSGMHFSGTTALAFAMLRVMMVRVTTPYLESCSIISSLSMPPSYSSISCCGASDFGIQVNFSSRSNHVICVQLYVALFTDVTTSTLQCVCIYTDCFGATMNLTWLCHGIEIFFKCMFVYNIYSPCT